LIVRAIDPILTGTMADTIPEKSNCDVETGESPGSCSAEDKEKPESSGCAILFLIAIPLLDAFGVALGSAASFLDAFLLVCTF